MPLWWLNCFQCQGHCHRHGHSVTMYLFTVFWQKGERNTRGLQIGKEALFRRLKKVATAVSSPSSSISSRQRILKKTWVENEQPIPIPWPPSRSRSRSRTRSRNIYFSNISLSKFRPHPSAGLTESAGFKGQEHAWGARGPKIKWSWLKDPFSLRTPQI